MEGLYVDQAHCLHIVQVPPSYPFSSKKTVEEEIHWNVHAADKETIDGSVMTLIEKKEESSKVSNLTLVGMEDEKVKQGTYDESQKVFHWDDGDAWHPLYISNVQAHLMTRRPYVPITVLVLFFMQRVFNTSKSWVRRIVSPEDNKSR